MNEHVLSILLFISFAEAEDSIAISVIKDEMCALRSGKELILVCKCDVAAAANQTGVVMWFMGATPKKIITCPAASDTNATCTPESSVTGYTAKVIKADGAVSSYMTIAALSNVTDAVEFKCELDDCEQKLSLKDKIYGYTGI